MKTKLLKTKLSDLKSVALEMLIMKKASMKKQNYRQYWSAYSIDHKALYVRALHSYLELQQIKKKT